MSAGAAFPLPATDFERGLSSALELTALNQLKAGPITTAEGLKLKVSFAVDPVVSLHVGGLAGHRVEARIIDSDLGKELSGEERRKLLPWDFATIDLAALERGMSRLGPSDASGPPRLVIQLSFASLSNTRARSALIAKAAGFQHLLRQAAICELVDMEPGIPLPRIMEMAALIRPYFRTLWLQVQPRRALLETAKAARIQGLSVRSADLGRDTDEIVRGMRTFASQVPDGVQILTVSNLPSSGLLVEALAAGFSHATLRAPA